MPNATKSESTERFELKTLPDGFVVLKRMSYGQVVDRRSLMSLSLNMGKRGSKNADIKGELAMANREIQMFEFRVCIVDHNLEDSEGRKLNLTTEADFVSLDPQVGQEIETLIGKMNNFDDMEDDPELGN